MLFHLKIIKSGNRFESQIDLREEELKTRFVEPFLAGKNFIINGTTIEPQKISRMKISRTETSIKTLIKKLEDDDEKDKSQFKVFRTSPILRAIDSAEDVTNEYLVMPPSVSPLGTYEISHGKSNSIFVVHGQDNELKNEVEIFLTNLGLNPIVLHRQLDEGLTIIEKFEKHSDVKYAIILLTPDDIGYSSTESKVNEKLRRIEFRARQNVIFEFGYFIGKLTRKNVCCLYKSGVTLPSDVHGLIYKPINKSVEEVGLFIIKELKNCGFKITL